MGCSVGIGVGVLVGECVGSWAALVLGGLVGVAVLFGGLIRVDAGRSDGTETSAGEGGVWACAGRFVGRGVVPPPDTSSGARLPPQELTMTAKRRPANAARHSLWRLEAYTYLASVVHICHV